MEEEKNEKGRLAKDSEKKNLSNQENKVQESKSKEDVSNSQ